MNRAGRTMAAGVAAALGIGVIAMYFVLGGCEATRSRSCVGALLAITAGVAGDFSEECRNGPCPERRDWARLINEAKWTQRRKCPKGGTYSIEIAPAGELDSWKTYHVKCTVHGDLETAKKLIDKQTYDQLRNLVPVAYRPD